MRIRRATPEATDSLTNNELRWTGLRAKSTRAIPTHNSTRITIRATATGNINSSTFRQVGVLGTRIIPTYTLDDDGTSLTTTLQPSRNPIYAAIDILTNQDYGLGVPIEAIDMTTAIPIANQCESEAVYFDFIFDRAVSIAQALNNALRVARASTYYQDNQWRFYRDNQPDTATTFIAARDIIEGSYKSEILNITDPNVDGIEVEYIDANNFWRPATEKYPTEAIRPTPTLVNGITDPTQALAMAKYLYASDKYGRHTITFKIRQQGLLLTKGDVIAVPPLTTSQIAYITNASEIGENLALHLDKPKPAYYTHAEIRGDNNEIIATLTREQFTHPPNTPELRKLLIDRDPSLPQVPVYFFDDNAGESMLYTILTIDTDKHSNTTITAIAYDSRIREAIDS